MHGYNFATYHMSSVLLQQWENQKLVDLESNR